ncbi:STAS domain-containing protein [Streptomyces sp. B1I3]|uniref:STAS domain-containing protein n=1 Tax=Streptomyces sp. B1I3 TaxID=3042264 RepID=UPI0027836B1F|nr:STAS domain-containing protein [Streptomyces sp. B1I3]MDQ0795777.1 anti-anti-sigma factor [Streptomyces sp. B1I3]
MTDRPCPPLTLAVEAGPGAVRLRLAGDLDYDTSDQFVERAQACLAADPGLRDLFLDCAGLRLCDSTGVSGLLLIHRGTTSRGVVLHLENPPAFLLRILDVTGTRRLFALDGAGRQAERTEDGPPLPAEARRQAVPPPSPSG